MENIIQSFTRVPAFIRYAPHISNNCKIFYIGLISLVARQGFSWASNDYISNLFNVSKRTVTKRLAQLKELNLIKLEYNMENKNPRKIYLLDIPQTIEGLPSFYAIVTSDLIAKSISCGAKLLYIEANALCKKNIGCWASNKYFSEVFNKSKRTICRYIKELETSGTLFNYVNGSTRILFNRVKENAEKYTRLILNKKNKFDLMRNKINDAIRNGKDKIFKKTIEELKAKNKEAAFEAVRKSKNGKKDKTKKLDNVITYQDRYGKIITCTKKEHDLKLAELRLDYLNKLKHTGSYSDSLRLKFELPKP